MCIERGQFYLQEKQSQMWRAGTVQVGARRKEATDTPLPAWVTALLLERYVWCTCDVMTLMTLTTIQTRSQVDVRNAAVIPTVAGGLASP